MTTEPEPAQVMVALPLGMLRLLMGSMILVILIMLAMLAVEIVILSQVFDLVDLVEKMVPAG
jgi:hypothetical protein